LNLDHRVLGAETVALAAVLPATERADDDLRILHVAHDLGRDARPGNERRADAASRVVLTADRADLVLGEAFTFGATAAQVNLDAVASGDSVLLVAIVEDSVHWGLRWGWKGEGE